MAKLIILSVVLMTFGVPIWFATSAQPARALRKVQTTMVVFIFIWVYLCLRWYPALVPLK